MDIITGTNLKGKGATVFCTDKPRRAVGPVFESKDEAEKFVSFLESIPRRSIGAVPPIWESCSW